MIWIISFIVVVIASAFLARRSMRDYEDYPAQNLEHGVFLIKNPKGLSGDFFKKLKALLIGEELLISIEHLSKGSEKAILIFGPLHILRNFTELKLLELEDYLLSPREPNISSNIFDQKKISIGDVYTWYIQPKQSLNSSLTIKSNFLKHLELDSDQRFFWQVVISPIKNATHYQTTIRAMVVDPNPINRVELAKKMADYIKNLTGLDKKQSQKQIPFDVFESFKQRTLIPKEVAPFEMQEDEIIRLLGLN